MNEVLKADKWENKNLIVMVGLPYSGKSTLARKMGHPIVCPDCVRISLHGHKFIPEAEQMVWTIVRKMVESLFLAGHDRVILDATNTTHKRRQEWVSTKWATVWRQVDTSKKICIERAEAAGDMAIIPIIEAMAEKFQPL